VTRALHAVEVDSHGRPVEAFCGHCGRPPEPTSDAQPASRVCRRCGLGLVLQAPKGVAPQAGEPFLVVDSRLEVCAVSRKAEDLLGVAETHAVNRAIAEFLIPAEAESSRPEDLLAQLVTAATSQEDAHTVVVRPVGEFGVRYRARIGPCGPPRAALIVLGD
jgi:PAS domain-containing protein